MLARVLAPQQGQLEGQQARQLEGQEQARVLEARVLVLQNEKDDLTSQVSASVNVKGFMVEKIRQLEAQVETLQGQTDNDKEIISFLDGSLQKQERERDSLRAERDALAVAQAKLERDVEELRSQKKVLVQEVKRLRKQGKAAMRRG